MTTFKRRDTPHEVPAPVELLAAAAEQRMVLEEITPQRAVELLARNKKNRKLRPSKIASYARDMQAHRWMVTGEAIKILRDGDLEDGQHRLHACVKAGVPFWTYVLYNADPTAHFAIDTGLKRTLGDELHWRGEQNVDALAAILSLLWRYEKRTLADGRVWPTHHELIEFLEVRPECRDATAAAQRVAKKIPVSRTPFGVLHTLLHRQHSTDEADAFTLYVQDGLGCGPGDPPLALRQFAINVASSTRVRPDGIEWLAVCIKTANAWLCGRPMKSVSWRRFGPKSEPFPRLVERDLSLPEKAADW